MSIKYFIGTIGEGFITHEDQEVNGLSFQCYPANVVAVTGDDLNISNWALRTNAIEKTKEEAQVLINTTISNTSNNINLIIDHPTVKNEIIL